MALAAAVVLQPSRACCDEPRGHATISCQGWRALVNGLASGDRARQRFQGRAPAQFAGHPRRHGLERRAVEREVGA
jgi:hypothetical protein